MQGTGPTGQFANLKCKNKFEIPMAVLLPSGGPVNANITGTDCDGIREVKGITAIYEAKDESAKIIPKGQFRALKAAGHFFVKSVWSYTKIDENSPATSENEELARSCGYTYYSVPISAVVYARPEARQWLTRYLKDCKFDINWVPYDGVAFDIPPGKDARETHIFRPTQAWLCLAHLPDYYFKYKEGNYCHPTFPPYNPQIAEF